MKIDGKTKLKDLPEEVVEKLIRDAWERYQKRRQNAPNENSKNSAEDEKKERVEKIADKREKVKSSTKIGGESPESPDRPGETGETGESPGVSVDNSNKSQSHETEKNRISARLIDRDVVESEDGRKVTIDVYDTGQFKEYIEGDKVTRVRQIKFILKYKSIVKECVDDCRDAVKEIAKATHYSPSSKDIMAKISELREEYVTPEEVPLTDYVREKYADRLAEIEKDPIAWIMSRTKEIVGYDRLKLLTFLSLVSTRMERVMGMSRIHVMVVGGSGTGKSSTVKSVLKFADDIAIPSTRVTQNALGYLPIDTFDGRVLFIEQIDRQNMNYLRELMTEEKVCTTVTEKAVGEDGEEHLVSRTRCIEGQPAVITTSVVDTIDVDKEQIFNRMLKVYVRTDQSVEDKIWKAIMNRGKNDVDQVDAMVFKVWLLTRPAYAKIPEDVTNAVINFMRKLKEYTREPLNRTVEVARNLIIVTAIMRGRTEATLDDWYFVSENFQLDLLYNGLGLSERDVEFIEALPDDSGLKSSEVADKLKVSKQYAINVLKNLERKGLVEGEKADNRTYIWYLTPLGRQIKALVNNVGGVVTVRDDKGELIGAIDSKFRSDADGRVDTGNAVSGNDGNGMSRGDGETDSVAEAYKYLKEHGWTLTTDLTGWFGDDIIDKLKAKDLVTFNVIDGVEYVNAK
ncbi:TrmB family transcriptional regulator [Sulfolobus sp. S-194]|uniref:helix-turn-helix domain-containing protein n=1 Tax=Sulfolobus sp. S-194 TaxID=2512240 RepID=UPI001436D837|nr:helix-turn-helix domain-containing protein [Sulfolobus sp. S-194]QIW23253.1 TrmB family transcriptional regulator [Sulfolobus sp. S-194]